MFRIAFVLSLLALAHASAPDLEATCAAGQPCEQDDTGMIQAKAQMKEMKAKVEGEADVAQTRAAVNLSCRKNAKNCNVGTCCGSANCVAHAVQLSKRPGHRCLIDGDCYCSVVGGKATCATWQSSQWSPEVKYDSKPSGCAKL